MTLTEAKAELRKTLLARRKIVHGAGGDAAANRRLADRLGEVRRGVIIAGYRPIRTEIDPTPTMAALALAGARVCVPVIETAEAPLKFREWTPGCAMVEGAFKAEIPASGAWLTPSILITPLVGWSRSGWRIGYGGGFYDRTLERLRAEGDALAIGFAYAAQEVDAASPEATDQRLDAIVTETEVVEISV